LESWGGATFDSCIRFIGEDPWDRIREIKKVMPNTKQQMLLRDTKSAWLSPLCSAEAGMDVFRILDAMNDLRNLATSIDAVKNAGKQAQGAICYTVSPVHSLGEFVEQAKQLEAMGCDSVAIKDMAGLLTPLVVAELTERITHALSIPMHLHSHDTAGMSSKNHLAAVVHGCRHIGYRHFHLLGRRQSCTNRNHGRRTARYRI